MPPVSPRSRLLATLLAAPLAAGVAGCAAGPYPQTYLERTAADSENISLGALAIRNLSVLPPDTGALLKAGTDATAVLTITSTSPEPDTLVEVTSPAAASVKIIANGKVQPVVVPPLGSTGNAAQLLLENLTATYRTGTFVPMTLRFARNGSVQALVPIKLATDGANRPIFTGDPNSPEGEPALGGPAGGVGTETPAGGPDYEPNDNQPQDPEKGAQQPGETVNDLGG